MGTGCIPSAGALVPETLVGSPKECLSEWDVQPGCGFRAGSGEYRLHEAENG